MNHLFAKTALASLLVASALTARADVLHCDYLTDANGSPAPGLSRPTVDVDSQRAQVEIFIEGGRSGSSRVNYQLTATSGTTYADDTGRASLQLRSGSAVLHVDGYRALCR